MKENKNLVCADACVTNITVGINRLTYKIFPKDSLAGLTLAVKASGHGFKS